MLMLTGPIFIFQEKITWQHKNWHVQLIVIDILAQELTMMWTLESNNIKFKVPIVLTSLQLTM